MVDPAEFAYDEMDKAIAEAQDVRKLRPLVERILRVIQKQIARLAEEDAMADPAFDPVK